MINNNLAAVFERIKNSSFLKSVLSLSSGVVIGQAINMIGMPIIGRVYTAADIGDYTLITTNANVILSISALGMLTVFMLPEKDSEARELSRLVTYSTIVISLFCVIILSLVSPWWRLIKTEEVSYSVALAVLWAYVIMTSVNSICYAYSNRLRLYKVLFWNPVIGAGVNIVLGIIFGTLHFGFVGYTLAHIISMVINILHLIVNANPYAPIPWDERQGYRKLLKAYQRFPKYQMPANLVSSVATQIPLEIMSFSFSATVLGYYSMANRILSLPMSLLATPINRVYFQEASQRYQRGEDIAEFGFKIMETNIKIAIIPVVILMVFGRWIFSFFLGVQWETAGAYAAVLGVYYLVSFCASCLSGSFVIIGKNSWNLVCSIANVGIGVLLFVLIKLIPSISAMAFMFIMALSFTVERVVEEGVFFSYLGFRLKDYILFVLKWILFPFVTAFGIQFLFGLLRAM